MVALEMGEDRMVLCFGTQQLVIIRFVPGATYHPFFKTALRNIPAQKGYYVAVKRNEVVLYALASNYTVKQKKIQAIRTHPIFVKIM